MSSSTTYIIAHQTPDDIPAIQSLHEEAFGPGRYVRTAFRIRETAEPATELCFVARNSETGELVGSVILSHITIGVDPSLLLGPLAVSPVHKSKGAGKMLMRHAVEAAGINGYSSIILVGDEPYYSPFGFAPIPVGQITLPGPVDPSRLLACSLVGDKFSASGPVQGSDAMREAAR